MHIAKKKEKRNGGKKRKIKDKINIYFVFDLICSAQLANIPF
jgi:hypothetical protein